MSGRGAERVGCRALNGEENPPTVHHDDAAAEVRPRLRGAGSPHAPLETGQEAAEPPRPQGSVRSACSHCAALRVPPGWPPVPCETGRHRVLARSQRSARSAQLRTGQRRATAVVEGNVNMAVTKSRQATSTERSCSSRAQEAPPWVSALGSDAGGTRWCVRLVPSSERRAASVAGEPRGTDPSPPGRRAAPRAGTAAAHAAREP